jgi:hypothetical protein
MKLIFTVLIALISVIGFSQSSEPISIEMAGTTFRAGDKITFYVNCDKSYTAEVAVFCDNFLGYHTNSALTSGRHEYTVETKDWKPGKYYIVVSSGTIHVQKAIYVE